jgi:hypothetical protein
MLNLIQALAGVYIGLFLGVWWGLSIFAVLLFRPTRKCPGCSAPIPWVRTPATLHQALWGGWTCRACGCTLDRLGSKVRD